MKLFNIAAIMIAFPCCLMLQPLNTNGQKLILEIKSEHKKVWSDNGKLEEITRKKMSPYFLLIKSLQSDILNKKFNSYADRALTNLDLYISSSIELIPYFNKEKNLLHLKCIFLNNKIRFFMTTPDIVPGIIGRDRKYDPFVTVTYDVIADFPIEQNNTLESIKFETPLWYFSLTNFESRNLEKRTDKVGIDFLKPWFQLQLFGISDFRYTFQILNELSTEYNNYIESAIKQNAALQTELKLDENQQLNVINSGDSKLIFQHNYTPSGIVKRNVTTKPGEVSGKPNSTQPTTVPGSTSPVGGIGGRNNSSKPPPIIKKPVRKN